MMVQPLCFQEAAACFPRKNSKSFSSKLQSRLEHQNFPALPQSSGPAQSYDIPTQSIPLTSAVNGPSTSSSTFNQAYDFNPSLSESHKRRAPSSISKTPKKKFTHSTPPNPLMNFHSSIMKEQLINSDMFKSPNGVCINNKTNKDSPNEKGLSSNSLSSEHSYSKPLVPKFNRLKKIYSFFFFFFQ